MHHTAGAVSSKRMAGSACRQIARGIVSATPQELAVLQSEPPAMAAAAPASGTELKVIQS